MKNQGFIHSMDLRNNAGLPLFQKTIPPVIVGILFLFVVGIGIGSGLFMGQKNQSAQFQSEKPQVVETSQAAGIIDKKTFKDNSSGILREGGMEGEGNFHIERPGGKSQNVYLTSSTVDLSKYVGKKVRVWGQTFQGNKAGWLMDVGLVEIQ